MRSDCTMRQFEVYIEESTPCGGTKYAKKEFFEVEAESPEAYVLAHAKWPIRAVERNGEGDLVITTGDVAGNLVRYVFSE